VAAGPGARRRRSAALAWGVAGAAIAAAAAAWVVPPGRGPGRSAERLRLTVQPPSGTSLSGAATAAALSPDGRSLAFIATDSTGTGRIWRRDLGALEARLIEGTDHADQPFWSPDGRWLAFFAEGKLKKVAVAGGRPEVLCEAPDPRGGTWGTQGTIVFAPIATGPLFSVSADGGQPAEVVRPDSSRQESALRFPEFLPDGRQFLFVSLPRRDGEYEVYVGRLGSPERRPVMRAGSAPVYAEPGYLIAALGARLVAQRFDARSAELSGKPLPLGEAPLRIGHEGVRAASASRHGVLAYWSGSLSDTKLAWLDRTGRPQRQVALPTGRWEDIAMAPDGRRAVVSRRSTATDLDLWLVDLEGRQSSRFTFEPTQVAGTAVWSPDGLRVAHARTPRGPFDLFVQPVSGGEPQLLYESDAMFKNPYSWSPDGEFIAFEQPDRRTGWDLWVLPVHGDRRPVPVIRTPANEGGGWFSPDGRWIIYSSDESGRPELYVQSFPQPTGRFRLAGSATSGTDNAGPAWWSRDGREVLFIAADRSVRVVAVEAGATFRAGPTRTLFQLPVGAVSMAPTPDLQRLLVTMPSGETAAPAMVIDLNWTAALREP
jgi:Tol biopolymer transport system component